MSATEFINTPTGSFVIVVIGISIVLALLTILVVNLAKNGKSLKLMLDKKKSEEDDKLITSSPEELMNYFMSHKFFTSVKYEYVENDFEFGFEMYDKLLSCGIKNEEPNLVSFKKAIANKFLSQCLFKYINNSTKTWVQNVINDYSATKNKSRDYHPESMCDIIEHLIHFTNETKNLAVGINCTVNGKLLRNIPEEFVDVFCNVVSKTITDIQKLFSSIIYMSNTTWVEKMYEILDIYEFCLNHIKQCVDSTLVILNGQMKKYVDNVFK